MTPDPNQSGLIRNLGRFAGHLWHSVRADPGDEKHEVSREVEESEGTAPDGRKVTLRRTTIEEVEIRED